jgi:heme-degrading monooxygenase HmoA
MIRTVRLTIRPQMQDVFLETFQSHAEGIRQVAGCRHLELWQDRRYTNIYCTLSHWDTEESFDAYRDSELFKRAWQAVKQTFAAPPQAFSYRMVPDAD